MKAMQTLLIVALLVFAGCMTQPKTPEQAAYLAEIENTETTFMTTMEQSTIVWARAFKFIATFSSFPIIKYDGAILGTEKTYPGAYGYEYIVRRKPARDGLVSFHVFCYSGSFGTQRHAERNAKILAYFLKTGELPYTEFISVD